MRIIALTRILNEDDIVEAFIRHHAAHVDGHILLDNGSTDRTLDILRALRDEAPGRLDLLQVRSATFCEQLHNTFLYQRAAAAGADWACYLDTDEFLDLRAADAGPEGAPGDAPIIPLRTLLAAVPPEQEAVTLPLINYYTTAGDDPAELLIPRRLRHRIRTPQGVDKLFIRGGLPGAQVLNGNHAAIVGNRPVRAAPLAGARLAHYHTRSPLQFLAKAVIGRVKVLAAGAEARPEATSSHYTHFLDTLRDAPEALLSSHDFMAGLNAALDLVDDPIAYAGTPLTHTRAGDPTLRAIRCLADAAETLARSHSRILDENTAVQTQVRMWNTEFRRLT